ncbi:MAG: flagellar hook capping FlgD N-terminal domain-containing protein [Rhodosalinus sp.]
MRPDLSPAAAAAQTVTPRPATQSSGNPPTAGARPATISSDFETFLRMLTVQMQNQDPLNPIESSDFAVQLATFSGVEQQVLTNELLSTLSGDMGSGPALSHYAAWVGMDARTGAPVDFDGAPLDLELPSHPSADTGWLVVRDAAGKVVQERQVAPGTGELVWDGTAPGSLALPPGSYSLSVRWMGDGAELAELPVETYQRVSEVRLAPEGQVEVVLRGGAAVPSDGVTAVRGPSAAG